MVKEIFIADKELLQLANYTLLNYEEFETKYTIDNNVYDIKKEVGDDYSFLSIETNNKNLAFLAYYDEKKDSDDEWKTVFPLSVEISFFDKERNVGFEVSSFLKKYNSINYYRYPFRKMMYPEYRQGDIFFSIDGKKVKTYSAFERYNNDLYFYRNKIEDYKYNYHYYTDGDEIKLIYDSRIDVYHEYYYDQLKEKIDNFDIEKEIERIISEITSKYPYPTYKIDDKIYDIIREYLVNYKAYYEDLLYVRLEEVRETIKNRKIILEERKRAPYFSKEELTEIINYLTNYKKSDTDSLQKKKHM